MSKNNALQMQLLTFEWAVQLTGTDKQNDFARQEIERKYRDVEDTAITFNGDSLSVTTVPAEAADRLLYLAILEKCQVRIFYRRSRDSSWTEFKRAGGTHDAARPDIQVTFRVIAA